MVEPVSSDLLAPPTEAGSIPSPRWQAAVGAAVVLVAAGMALGALQIPGDAGYGGVGPHFLPWLCAAVLALCGVLLVREAGGYVTDPQGGDPRASLDVVAGNPHLHAFLREQVAPVLNKYTALLGCDASVNV